MLLREFLRRRRRPSPATRPCPAASAASRTLRARCAVATQGTNGIGSWNALVVGGSGMLHGACLQLARDGWHVGAVWKATQRLDSLVAAAAGLPGTIAGIPCDFEDTPCFARCLGAHVASTPPIRLVITWVHGDAQSALQATVDAVSRKPADHRTLLEVHASVGDEHHPVTVPLELGSEWTRRHATLGFRLDDEGHRRWLTDREIADGVSSAIRGTDPAAVIGRVGLWSAKR